MVVSCGVKLANYSRTLIIMSDNKETQLTEIDRNLLTFLKV